MEIKIIKCLRDNVYMTDLGCLRVFQDGLTVGEAYEFDTNEEFVVGGNLHPSYHDCGFTVEDGITYVVGTVDEILDEQTAVVNVCGKKWVIEYQGELQKQKIALKVNEPKLVNCNY